MRNILISILVLFLLVISLVSCIEEKFPVATPTFSPVAGEVNSGQKITIITETEGATIYYTDNGDDPTIESTLYSDTTKPTITATNTTIKAIAVKDEMLNSTMASATYTIKPPITHTLTINIVGTGSVSVSLGGTLLTGGSPYTIENNGDIELIATSTSPHAFQYWSGDIYGTSNTASIINMVEDKEITATFVDTTTLTSLIIRVPNNIWNNASGYEVIIDDDGNLVTNEGKYIFDNGSNYWGSTNIQSLYTVYNDVLPIPTQYPPSSGATFVDKTFYVPAGIYDIAVIRVTEPTGWNGTTFIKPPTPMYVDDANPAFRCAINGNGGLRNNEVFIAGETVVMFIDGNQTTEKVALGKDGFVAFYGLPQIANDSVTVQPITGVFYDTPFYFTLKNISANTLDISNISFTNTPELSMTALTTPISVNSGDTINIEFTAIADVIDSGLVTITSNAINSPYQFRFSCSIPIPITLPESFEGADWDNLENGNEWTLSTIAPVLSTEKAYTGTQSVKLFAAGATNTTLSMTALIDVVAGQSLTFKYIKLTGSGTLKIYDGQTLIDTIDNVYEPNFKTHVCPPFATSGVKTIKFEGKPGQYSSSNLEMYIDDIDLIVSAPEINVKYGIIDIPNGSTVDLGSIIAEINELSFIIENIGTSQLNLTGNPQKVTITPITPPTGAGLQEDASDIIGYGNYTSFKVVIAASTLGTKTISVSIPNNDSDENPYNFTFTVTVVNNEFLFENFEDCTGGALPSGWVNEFVSGEPSLIWETFIDQLDDDNGVACFSTYSPIGSPAEPTIVKLVTNPIDLSSATSDATLTFKFKLPTYAKRNDQIRVYVKIGAFGLWSSALAEYTNASEIWMPLSVTLPNTAGESAVYIAFEGKCFYQACGGDVYIDDVVVLP